MEQKPGWKIVVKKQDNSRRWGVYGAYVGSNGWKFDLLEGGFSTRFAAEEARRQHERENLKILK